MLQELLESETETLKHLNKQLTEYKSLLKNAYEEKTCKFANVWPALKNRYQVLELIGKGGFSEVYKAYDLE
jgi:tousled-like kinase